MMNFIQTAIVEKQDRRPKTVHPLKVHSVRTM
jgi:hypothetical protein